MFKTLKKLVRCLSIVPLMCTSMFSHNQVTYDLNNGSVKSANINVDNGFRSYTFGSENAIPYSTIYQGSLVQDNLSSTLSTLSNVPSTFANDIVNGRFVFSSTLDPLDHFPSTSEYDFKYAFGESTIGYFTFDILPSTFYKIIFDMSSYINPSFSWTSDDGTTTSSSTLWNSTICWYNFRMGDSFLTSKSLFNFGVYPGGEGYSSCSFTFYGNSSSVSSKFFIVACIGNSFTYDIYFFNSNTFTYYCDLHFIPYSEYSYNLSDSQALVDELQSNYDTLSTQYASLLEQYNDLKSKYDSLVTSNTELQSKYDNLKDVYEPLVFKYNNLVSSYYQLYSSYSYTDWTSIFNPSSYMYVNTSNGISSLQYQPITTTFYNSSSGSISGSYMATPNSMLQCQSGVLWFMNNDVNPLKSLYSDAIENRGDSKVYYSMLKCNPCIMNNEDTEKIRVYITKSHFNELLDKLSYKYLIKFQDMNHTNLLDLTGTLVKTDFNISSEYIGGSVSSLGSYYYADIDVPSTSIKGIQYIISFNYLSSTNYLKLCGIGVADNSINDAYVSGFNDASSMISSEIDELNQKYAEIENNYNNLKVVYDDYIEAYNETKIKEAYNKGYNSGRSSVSDEGASITTLFTSIVGVPITILNGLGVLTVWDIPLISVLLSLMFAMLLLWLIKRLI